jgi:dUTP pyrophosphatase
MQIGFKKLPGAEDLPEPAYAHPGDAGLDLYTREEVTLLPGKRVAIPTGLTVVIPEGYVGLVWDKSGLAIREGLKTLGGVVDAGYRGEVLVGMVNVGDKPYTFLRGHKVAQLLIQKIEQAEIVAEETLDETSRGEGGFGSTGK